MSAEAGIMTALIYVSDAVGVLDEPRLREILERARAQNAQLGITGILLSFSGRFVQYLEGPADHVATLFASIREDPRHERVRVLMEAPADKRRFGSWSMGYEPVRVPAEPIPPGFRSTLADLEHADTPDQVLRALNELTLWFRTRASQG